MQTPDFNTTRWSVVTRAARDSSSDARDALAQLCQTYWYPIYSYVRRRGYSVHDAQDLTQEFFARLLARKWVTQADQQRGRFRSFLLSAVKHFLANEWEKARTQKRGGGEATFLPLDTAELRFAREPADTVSAEEKFDRRWAVTLLEAVLGRLREEYEAKGKADLFAALSPALVGDDATPASAALAGTLGLSDGALRVAIHRLRHRYRSLLRLEIANTVDHPDEIEAEMRHLFAVLSQPAR